MNSSSNINSSLIAPCGMNCAVCSGFLREKNKCPGCNSESIHKPKYCISCKIKNCDLLRDTNSKFCYDCKKIPCARLKQLDKRYRTKYAMSMIENLNFIKESGTDKFIESEIKRWTCTICGETICVHRGYCLTCKPGKKRSN